ncbi:MAG: crotonase [Deltaproteobacteria bacterium]|nr:MAG: crotonase [Deltaproteobacteria bacterium]
MDFRDITIEVSGRVATVTLNRPKRRNALARQTVEELREALSRLDHDGGVGCIVLTGAGEKAFCSGGDLADGPGEGILDGHEGRRTFGRLLVEMRQIGTPIVARVNGYALGGGLGLVAASDLAVAVESAKFGTPEIDVGLFPWMIAAVLYRTLPQKWVNRLVYTGEKISAATAQEIGLVNEVVSPERLDETTAALAETIASKSPAVLGLGRRGLAVVEGLPLERAVEFLASQLTLNTLTEDAMEGVAAFLEKRPPKWAGR